jgi:flagellar basal-body rod protein FlgC
MSIRSTFAGFETSVAGMLAERKRMEILSLNIANANTVGPDGPYVRKAVIFKEILGAKMANAGSGQRGQIGRGVAVQGVYEDTRSEHPKIYQPEHPFADKEGFVRQPNVNIMYEMVDIQAAKTAYAANMAVLKNFRSMTRDTIDNLRSN